MYFIVIIVLVLIFCLLNNREQFCDRVESTKNIYHESLYDSNISNAFDCYAKCLDSLDCSYVGIGFDCHNKCFDNLGYYALGPPQ